MNRTKTRDQLIRVGSEIIAQQGFNTAGINAVLSRAGVPKGSFYYYFTSKEDFGLAVIDDFAAQYSVQLDGILENAQFSPLRRLRNYFDAGISDMEICQCTRGCLIGNLGQELSAQNEVFRARIDQVFEGWEQRLVQCLEAARKAGEIDPNSDPAALGEFILSGWEGSILRAKVTKSVEPMRTFARILFEKVLR